MRFLEHRHLARFLRHGWVLEVYSSGAEHDVYHARVTKRTGSRKDPSHNVIAEHSYDEALTQLDHYLVQHNP